MGARQCDARGQQPKFVCWNNFVFVYRARSKNLLARKIFKEDIYVTF